MYAFNGWGQAWVFGQVSAITSCTTGPGQVAYASPKSGTFGTLASLMSATSWNIWTGNPSWSPIPLTVSVLCAPYTSAGGSVSTCTISNVPAGAFISLGTTYVAGAVPGKGAGACTTGSDDTYLSLLSPSGSVLAFNDDFGSGGCSFLTYTTTVGGTYTIKEQCWSTTSCYGTVAYTYYIL